MERSTLTTSFLWISVLGWAVGLGAKLFDLLVLAGAWGATPPASLALYPYGRQWPLNPGSFFQPLSVLILLGSVGALASGWKTTIRYRIWLWVPLGAFALIWLTTPTLFWPMITDLYAIAHGKLIKSDAEVAQLVHRWIVYDWLRVVVIGIGFVASVRAISMPHREK